MEMCCKNCVYKHYLKYMFLDSAKGKREWRTRSICTMLLETEGGEYAFALYVNDNDMCEVFTPREEVE